MARKRTHTDSPRTKLVSVRLREETFDRVTAAAAAASMSRASYVEGLIENRAVKIERVATDALPVPFINELKRIGNNLNQIAHSVNCNIPPQEGAVARVMAEIMRTLAENEVARRRLADAIGQAPPAAYSSVERAAWQSVTRQATPTPSAAPEPQLIERAVPQAEAGVYRPVTITRRPPPPPPSPSLTVPKGIPLKLQLIDGEFFIKDPSNVFVRVARLAWHKIRPPPDPDFTTEMSCDKAGTLTITRRPKQAISNMVHDDGPKATSPWSVLSGRMHLRPA